MAKKQSIRVASFSVALCGEDRRDIYFNGEDGAPLFQCPIVDVYKLAGGIVQRASKSSQESIAANYRREVERLTGGETAH